jgi:nucleoside-diphosphate-sugar epimerase
MKAIALTGASGFVGSRLAVDLRARGHRVMALQREQLVDPSLNQCLTGVDVLIHLAARAHETRDRGSDFDAAYMSANVELTRLVSQSAARAGVRRFIFLSSAGVLGRSSPQSGFSDQSSPAPYNSYTLSKLRAEELLREKTDVPPEIVILRPPLIYGPGARGNFDRLIKGLASGWPLPIGGLNAPRSMIGLRNMIDLIEVAVSHPNAPDAILLAADCEITSVAEFGHAISRELAKRSRIFRVPAWLLDTSLQLIGKGEDIARLREPFEVYPSEAKLRFEWLPPFSQAEEIRWMVSQYRQEVFAH